jgi:RHS repeat-associated protein
MTDAVGARNLFKVDAGVVHALLQARYYDGSKGGFLSEDPMFLGDPKQQNLKDPQSLNSYSYANDNPITKSDPSGKCIYDGCVVEAVAALGFAGGVATQAFHDYQRAGRLYSAKPSRSASRQAAAWQRLTGALLCHICGRRVSVASRDA